MCAKNMWGKLDDLEPIKTPTQILKEQGNFLYGATKGILNTETTVQTIGNRFSIDFDIVAPYLNEYRYNLLTIGYGLDFYPLKMVDKVHNVTYECESEEHFIAVVESVLSSREVRKIIQTLISQSKG
jgi:hypothetical protein